MRKLHKVRLLLPFAIVALTTTACAATSASETSTQSQSTSPTGISTQTQEILLDYGITTTDVQEVIAILDEMPRSERPNDLRASIQPDQLLLETTDGRQGKLPMPEDQFYVSFAPYEAQTHDCYFHSLTTCTGELQNQDISVKITDSDSGEVLLEGDATTFDNGFYGVWLPRGISAEMVIEHDGKTATADLSTRNSDDATCVTTVKLI